MCALPVTSDDPKSLEAVVSRVIVAEILITRIRAVVSPLLDSVFNVYTTQRVEPVKFVPGAIMEMPFK